MTPRPERIVTLLAALLCLPALAAGIPERETYAWRFELETGGAAGFYRAVLPPEVYRSVADPALRDAGVYNADGRAVPRRFVHPGAEEAGPERSVGLGLVPLDRGVSDRPDRMRLLLEQTSGETRLRLDTDEPRPTAGTDRPDAYLVDARDLDEPPVALELHWQQAGPDLIAVVRLGHSDDLEHWQGIGKATLADIDYQGTRIEQRRIALPAGLRDFLRIDWSGTPTGWRLAAVTAVLAGPEPETDRDWIELDAAVPEETGEYLYDAGGFPPVDRVALLPSETNGVANISVYCREDEDQRWRRVHRGLSYLLAREDGELASPPARVGVSRARFWKIGIESGVLAAPPRLRLGWRPDELLFLAQGRPPFELVSGRARDRLEGFPQADQLGDPELFSLLEEPSDAAVAVAGPRSALAGPGAVGPVGGFTWKTALLWAGLVAAVAAVGWMAVSLLRETSSG